MADSRTQRRLADPGLQPERRASLAWFRMLLGYGALLALDYTTALIMLVRYSGWLSPCWLW